MKTLVLGLGNPILSDDGAGFYVAEELKKRLNGRDIKIEQAGAGGLAMLDMLSGYDKAIIIDAIKTEKGKAGEIYLLKPEEFITTWHASSPHDVNFYTALELGSTLDMPLPADIDIFAIEVEDVTTFSEKCTPDVEAAIQTVVEMVMLELNQLG
jgi:hydrogenase maturation protease